MYIERVYVHTLTCLLVMLLLKPALVTAPLVLIWVFLKYVCRTLCGTWLLDHPFLRPVKEFSQRATQLNRRSSRVVVQLAKRESRRISRAAGHVMAKAKGRKSKHGQHETPSATDSGPIIDADRAAKMLQAVWRHRNPRVRAAHRNMAILKRNVRVYLNKAKVCSAIATYWLVSN